jgi:hypothetical protein
VNARASAALAGLLLHAGAGLAHDLITVEAAERYLANASEWSRVIASAGPAARRAEAHCRLGGMFDEIRDLLNRDIAVHGEPQGVPTNLLIGELKRIGAPLQYSDRKRRFLPPVAHFSKCLELQPGGPHAGEAMSGLLRGNFYESFEENPLEAAQTWDELREQIAIARRFLSRHSDHPDREEIEFIRAILLTRAAGSAPDAQMRLESAAAARVAADAFESRYPDSLRAAAMPLLREVLPR